MPAQQRKPQPKPKLVNVLEYASSDRPHKVDREKGVIHDVKILGLKSKNGPSYSPEAIKNGAAQYEGAHIFVAHPDRSRPDQERSPRDMIGWIEQPHVESDGLYGDLHYVKSHEMAGPLAEIAERRPDRIGLSHNAVVTESHRGSDIVYESISRVRSVDLVCKPATTRGIFESENPIMDETLDAAPVDPAPASLKDMILAKVAEILDGDGDPSGKASSISTVVKELLKVEEKLEEPAGDETTTTESIKEKRAKGAAKIDYDKALDVLESVGVAPNRVRMHALIRCESEAEAKTLAESWKTSAGQSTQVVKPRSGSVLESQQDKQEDGKARKERFDAAFDHLYRR